MLRLPLAAVLIFAAFACAFGAGVASAQESDWPASRPFPAAEIGGAPRSRSLVVHPDGRIFLGNDRGLFIFSDSKWQAVPSLTGVEIHGVAIDDEERVWYAGAGRFGFLEPDEDGFLQARPLEPQVPQADRDPAFVRKPIACSGGYAYVLLGSSGVVAKIDSAGTVNLVRLGETGHAIHAWEGAVYVQAAEAVWRIDGDQAGVDPAAPVVIKGYSVRAVRSLWPRPSGGAWVVATKGVRVWQDDKFPYLSEDVRTLLGEDNVICGCPLPDGGFALGANTKGLIFIDPSGKVVRRLTSTAGLGAGSGQIQAVATDAEGGLWVAHSAGVIRLRVDVPVPAPGTAPKKAAPPTLAQYTGRPLLRSFGEKDFSTSPYRALAIHPSGLVYVGTGSGVYEFDGTVWRAVSGTERLTVSALAVDAAGAIWYGARNEFGVLEPDERGELVARALHGRLPAEERDTGLVAQIAIHGGNVYLLAPTRARVIRVDARRQVQVLRGGEEGFSFCEFKGDLYLRGRTTAFRIEGDALRAELAAAAFMRGRGQIGRAVWPAGSNEGWILSEKGLQRWPGSGEARLVSAAVARLLGRDRLSCGTPLPDGNFALGSEAHGLLIVDPAGRILARYGEEEGLESGGEKIYAVATDSGGGLWIAHQGGVVRMECRAPVAVHGPAEGLRGRVSAMVMHHGRLHIGTTTGLYVRDAKTGRFLPRLPIQWDPMALISTEEGLLVGGRGLSLLRDDDTKQLIDSPPWLIETILRLPREPDVLVTGAGPDLRVYRLTEGRWRPVGVVEGFKGAVNHPVQDAAGWLWAGRDYRQIVRLDWRQGMRLDAPVETLGAAHGVPPFADERRNVAPLLIDGVACLTSSICLLRHDAATDRFVPETRLAGLPADYKAWSVFSLNDGSIWLWDKVGEGWRAGLARRDAEGAWRIAWLPSTGVEWLNPTRVCIDPEAGTIWMGRNGAVSLETSRPIASLPTPAARVRRVMGGGDSLIWGGAGALPAPLLPEHTTLQFHYSAAVFAADVEGDTNLRYRTRLEGFDAAWSEWTEETLRTYTNLPSGKLSFLVQAQGGDGRIGPEASFSFIVLPPWWRTWWAMLGWLGLGSAGVVGIVHLRTRILQRRAMQLEAVVAARTAALAGQNTELARLHKLELDEKIAARLGEEKARLEVLRYQLNPHFLFNSLTAIRAQIPAVATPARRAVERLVEFCQLTLGGRVVEHPATVGEEMNLIRVYLEIERERWEEPLGIEFDLDPAVAADPLPRLLLLPLVENALKYGRATSPGHLDLRLTARRDPADGALVIEVANTGTWVDHPGAYGLPTMGIGLGNIRERLRRHYPDAHEFSHQAADGWVHLCLRLRAGPRSSDT